MMDTKNVKNAQKEEFDWVPVEKRFPESGEMVLITFINVLDNKTLCVETACYDGEYWYGEDFYRIKAKVLAWKPLPKPYIPATPTIFPDEKNDFEKRINILDRVTGLSETTFHLKELYENLAPEQRDALADQFVKVLPYLDAKFTSVYDNGSVILTVGCKVNPKTREIFEVSENPITDEHFMTIVREYVTIDGKEYPAVDSMGYPDAVDNPEVYWY